MVCFNIVEESKTKTNRYGDLKRVWRNISRKSETTTGTYNTVL